MVGGSRLLLAVILPAVLAVLSAPLCLGIVENTVIELDAGLSALRNIDHPFGFLPGGTYELDIKKISPPPNETLLYVFYDNHDGAGLDATEMCQNVTQYNGENALSEFYFFERILEDPFHLNGTISVKGYYTLIFLYCSNDTTRFQLFFETTNPGGTNLSFAQIFLPQVYLSLALAWMILLAFMSVNWWRHRKEKIQAFSFMLFLFSTKFGLIVLQVFIWFWKAEKGSLFVGVLLFEFLSNYLYSSLFYYFLLAVGRGWCTVCPVVKKSVHQKILTTALSLAGFMLVYAIFRSYAVILVCLGFIFYLCLFIMFTRLVITHLQRQISYAQSERFLEVLIPGMKKKLKMMLAYQKLVIGYCLLLPTWLVLVNVFFPADEWVGAIGMEAIMVIMSVFLGRILHLRDFQLFRNNALDIHKDVADLLRLRRPKCVCVEFPQARNAKNPSSPHKAERYPWALPIQVGVTSLWPFEDDIIILQEATM